MKLSHLETPNSTRIVLEKHFSDTFDYASLSLTETKRMLSKVSETLEAVRKSSKLHENVNKGSYIKLALIERALLENFAYKHAQDLSYTSAEDFGKAQLMLAVKDLADRVQKMTEQIGAMIYQEAPAITDTIRSVMGDAQADQAGEALTSALQALSTALTTGRNALQQISTGVTVGKFNSADEVDMDLGDGEDTDGEVNDDELTNDDLTDDESLVAGDSSVDDLDDEEVEPSLAGRAKR